jgi:nitronate monooxygenase
MNQGASAVQPGTRFVATEKCDASYGFKYEFIRAGDEDIRIIKSPAGFPGRAIFNRSLQESVDGKRKPRICKYNSIRIRDPKTTEFCIIQVLLEAYKGNLRDGSAFTGSYAARITHVSTVKEVTEEMPREYINVAVSGQD